MNIGIVGLGLIGGSIGLKLQRLNHTIYGVTNNRSNEKKAIKRNLANFISCDLGILKKCSLIILALPIKDLIHPSEDLVSAIPKEAIVTDVGSIKEPIISTWEKIHPLFIGSHPMAGTEEKGVDSGFESLLENTKWIITPTHKSNSNSLKVISNLITSMGCEICKASPKEHDEAVSLISHLPIFVASSLIQTANTEKNKSLLDLTQKLAATGFTDTSRVGGGNPNLGLDLAINNQTNILNAIKEFKNNINDIEALIKNKNWELLSKKLTEAKEIRSNFIN
ncbi:Prephenate dehydrogenase [Prochlorococcus marinus str. MIT 9515]|uniref:Prephenate dehydrogenase n=1 Tax=Prochlorococcus marinus (strain MIT 9515) TaxID=167542 RepID=A2BYU8_PROM5|nr:prephenate/arogenate dehydrogenase [Prochlorococcus marinus]ABM72959.1 Prephenate dehydrogenase [Prochlorococcus marinus str. MIT 9515]